MGSGVAQAVNRRTSIGIRFFAAALALGLGLNSQMVSTQQYAPEPIPGLDELASLCTREDCRRNLVLQLRLADGEIHQERVELYRPPIGSDSVSILVGDEVRVVPEFARNNFTNWRERRRRELPNTPILSFQLRQNTDGTMAAALGNSGQSAVKIDLFVREPGNDRFQYRPTCPIPAGQTLFEYWDAPVLEMQVRSARVLPRNANLDQVCD
jgi:hypothetical protein